MPEHNFPAFMEAERELVKRGYGVYNPAERGVIPHWGWEDYLKADLRMVLDAHGIATLVGWEKSRGAKLEVCVARELNIPVKPLMQWPAVEGDVGS